MGLGGNAVSYSLSLEICNQTYFLEILVEMFVC